MWVPLQAREAEAATAESILGVARDAGSHVRVRPHAILRTEPPAEAVGVRRQFRGWRLPSMPRRNS